MQGFLHHLHNAGCERGRRLVRTRGDHDDRQQRIEGAQAVKCTTPTFDWQAQIEQHQINLSLTNSENGLVAGNGSDNVETFQSQDSRERLSDRGFVLDQQDGFLGFPFAGCVAMIHLNSVYRVHRSCHQILRSRHTPLTINGLKCEKKLTPISSGNFISRSNGRCGKLLSLGFPLAMPGSYSANSAYISAKLCQMET